MVRPDSGKPREVVLKVLEILGSKFGYETNAKGYRVLNPKVRVIQGDGVNYWTIQDTLTAMNRAGWSADNITFGMGGALLQQLNRDTQQFAFKMFKRYGEWRRSRRFQRSGGRPRQGFKARTVGAAFKNGKLEHGAYCAVALTIRTIA